MKDVRGDARAILEEFQQEGHISASSLGTAEFGIFDRLTPGWIILMAFKLAVLFRIEVDGVPAAQIAPELESGLNDTEAQLLVSSTLGDLQSMKEAQRRNLIDLEKILTLLNSAIKYHPIPEKKISMLFKMAEEECRNALESGDLPIWRLTARGGHVGPWDASEKEFRAAEQINFGGLWIPVAAGVRIIPVWLDSEVAGIVVECRDTTVRLQAFHGPCWEATRSDWQADAAARGGRVDEWVGPAGLELRGLVPLSQADNSAEAAPVRVIGCDGPSWTLYGVIRGRGALPEGVDLWAYEVFENTVVDATFSDRPIGERVKLTLPDEIIQRD